MKKLLTWQELKALALKHYNNGGDGVVECWSESDYDEIGHMTKEEALDMFEDRDEIIRDMAADAECYKEEDLEETEEETEEPIDYDWDTGFGRPNDDWECGDAPWDAPGMSINDFIR